MKKEEWEQIEKIVDRALELQGDEKTAYIRQTCGHNKKMLQKVEELLAYIDSAALDQFLETPEQDRKQLIDDMAAGWNVYSVNIFKNGDEIGLYEITGVVGSGGMGTVYKAGRADGTFQRDVAVKVIRRGMETEENVRRFSLERKLLASLDHPNIARLLDGGVTGEGLPYLIMDFVDGKPIDEYCSENELSIKQKLYLFGQVCRAVQFAHSKLIIHRDIKPKNIFVTDEGVAKVLDFGIAKLLDEEQVSIAQTKTGKPVMTPEYAAPEQFSPESVSIAVDVYGLGLILYEILTGTKPFDLSGKNIAQIERMICDEWPQKPSSRLSSKTRNIDGDLDVICLKALRKEPGERYGTVQEMLDDINRYLEGQPIAARPASMGYRIRKFSSRHKTGVSITGLLLVLITAFILMLIRLQSITSTERDRALYEARKAEQVTSFLSDLFKANDPNVAQGQMPTARDLLDHGAHQISSSFDDIPELRAGMMVLLGNLYRQIGEYETSQRLLEEGLFMAEQTGDLAIHIDALEWFGNLGMDVGRNAEALEAVEKAELLLKDAGLIPGERHGLLMYRLVQTLSETGKRPEAKDRAEAALALARNSPQLSVDGLHNYLLSYAMALLLHETQPELAESLLTEAMSLDVPFGKSAAPLYEFHLMLATALRMMNRYDEALIHDEEAFRLVDQNYPEIHFRRSTILNNMTVTLHRLGRYEEAKTASLKALEINKIIYPDLQHPRIIAIYNNIGTILTEGGKPEEGLPYLMMAQKLASEQFGNQDIRYMFLTANLGTTLHDLYRNREAEPLLLEALQLRFELSGPDSPHIGALQTSLATVYLREMEPDKALVYADDALALYQRISDESIREILILKGIRAQALDHLGHFEEAAIAFAEAVSFGDSASAETGEHWPHLLGIHAYFLIARNSAKAEDAVRYALDVHRQVLGNDHPGTIRMEEAMKEFYNQ